MNLFNNIRSVESAQVDFEWLLTHVVDLPKTELPMFNFSTNPNARSTGEEKANAIILDFDDGEVTFEDFVAQYKHLKFFIYTSSSDSRAKSKFRVVLPMRSYHTFNDIDTFVKMSFNNIDKSTTSTNRRFFVPSKYNADGDLTKRLWNKSGELVDVLNDIDALGSLAEYLEDAQDTFASKTSTTHTDCSSFPSVVKYLNTPYPKVKGNGGASRNGLYSSICACVKFDDNDTLKKVVNKALSEHWTMKEINSIIKSKMEIN